jgi:hypothetical protein
MSGKRLTRKRKKQYRVRGLPNLDDLLLGIWVCAANERQRVSDDLHPDEQLVEI